MKSNISETLTNAFPIDKNYADKYALFLRHFTSNDWLGEADRFDTIRAIKQGIPNPKENLLSTAFTVGESHLLTLLPVLAEKGVQVVIVTDIDPLVLMHVQYQLDCLKQSNSIDEFKKIYLENMPQDLLGYRDKEMLYKDLFNPIFFNDEYNLAKHQQLFNAAKLAAEKIVFAPIMCDMFNPQHHALINQKLKENSLQLTYVNVTNLHEYDKEQQVERFLEQNTDSNCLVQFSNRGYVALIETHVTHGAVGYKAAIDTEKNPVAQSQRLSQLAQAAAAEAHHSSTRFQTAIVLCGPPGARIAPDIQAKALLNLVRQSHKNGAGLVGVTYSANTNEMKAIYDAYGPFWLKKNQPSPDVFLSNQAQVIAQALRLLETDEYKDIKEVFRVIPEPTMTADGGCVDDKVLTNALTRNASFLTFPCNALIAWKNENTPPEKVAAIGGGVAAKILTPEQSSAIQSSLGEQRTKYSGIVIGDRVEGDKAPSVHLLQSIYADVAGVAGYFRHKGIFEKPTKLFEASKPADLSEVLEKMIARVEEHHKKEKYGEASEVTLCAVYGSLENAKIALQACKAHRSAPDDTAGPINSPRQ